MRTSTRFTAAIYTLLLIDYYKDQKVTSSFIAERMNGNSVIYRNLLSKLKEAGFVKIAQGKGKEGTKLNMPLSEITLWEVFKSVEDLDCKTIFKNCDQFVKLNDNAKIVSDIIYLYFEESIKASREVFSKVTLGQVMEDFLRKRNEEQPEQMDIDKIVTDLRGTII